MRKAIRFFCLLAIICLAGLSVGAVRAPANGITVILDGNTVNFGCDQPTIVNGRTLVPMRVIFDALGYAVNWNASTRQVTATKGNQTIILRIGSGTTTLNGQNQISLDVPPQIIYLDFDT